MYNRLRYFLKKDSYKDRSKDIEPDEIFLDSENLPKFDVDQFEGRLEKPITTPTFLFFGSACIIVFCMFFFRSYFLQAVDGATYLQRSENNRLKYTLIFTKRGIIYDRSGEKLAWNVFDENSPEFAKRYYKDMSGLSNLLGYIKYPSKDKYGFYYTEDFVGIDGIEKYYNNILAGQNGLKIIEIDASQKLQSENTIRPPSDGKDIKLSIDTALQSKLYNTISNLSQAVGFTGGAGVIMNVNTGEIMAITSYPEYNSQILTDGIDSRSISHFLLNKNNPFLNRAIDGLYTPGSIVKPFMAAAALSENIIDPTTKILSTGSISIPNPYDPLHPSVFKDWRAQGYVDMKQALAVSSDVYFYEVGGGYKDQKGLGITLIDKYMSEFGFGKDMPDGFFNGVAGVIPDPEWKKENFNGEDWRIGDTYHTAIGQYGFQVSPIQVVRAVGSIANGGKLFDPSIFLGGNPDNFVQLGLNNDYLKIVREGMKLGVDSGIAIGLKSDFVTLGAKTGTAELGSRKQFVNSWITGFFPYDNPKYAFAVIMEKGPVSNTTGGVYIMRQMLDWIHANRPEYFKS